MSPTLKILIIASPYDFHARVVAWSLRKYGAQVRFFDTSAGAPDGPMSYAVTDSSAAFCVAGAPDVDVVWNRRRPPKKVDGSVDVDDAKFVASESRAFELSMLELLEQSPDTRWVDKQASLLRAENKLLQLTTAHQHGLRVPETLVSTAPAAVRKFLACHDKVVAKSFMPHIWILDGAAKYAATASLVGPDDELSDDSIRMCPTIYQRALDKASDVRVVLIGEEISAVEYPYDPSTSIDVRVNLERELVSGSRAIQPPCDVLARFKALAAGFGISFASADFVVDTRGDWYFIDLNPVGQFLFNEIHVPELRLMDAMARHLLGLPAEHGAGWRLAEYLASDDYADYEKQQRVDSSTSIDYGPRLTKMTVQPATDGAVTGV